MCRCYSLSAQAEKQMNELEKLKRDMDTLRESLKLSSNTLHQRSPNELKGVLEHANWCLTELQDLQTRLRQLIK
jgi:hypothetical protein